MLGMTTHSHLLSAKTLGPSVPPEAKNMLAISQTRFRTIHQLHLDLMRDSFCFGLTTAANYSAFLFIVTTPSKLTGWIGLPTESTASIITALKSWLTQTELLGQTKSVRFICTDARSAFTSSKFIAACNYLGIQLDAAAPEHKEMNGTSEGAETSNRVLFGWCCIFGASLVLHCGASCAGGVPTFRYSRCIVWICVVCLCCDTSYRLRYSCMIWCTCYHEWYSTVNATVNSMLFAWCTIWYVRGLYFFTRLRFAKFCTTVPCTWSSLMTLCYIFLCVHENNP